MDKRKQIIEDIEKLHQAQAERDLHEIDEEKFNNITFETKLADYIEAEIENAHKIGYKLGLIDGLKENKDVSSFSLGSFFKEVKG